MQRLVNARNVFDSPAQTSAMTLLCWFSSDALDYASVSYGQIASWCGVKRRYVVRLMQELELRKHACVNLGPDPARDGRGKTRWKVTIDRAIAKVRAEAGVAADVPLVELPERSTRRKPSRRPVENAPAVDAGPVENSGAAAPAASCGDPGITSPAAETAGDAGDRGGTGDPGITTPVIQGSSPGDPGITRVVIPGSLQRDPRVQRESTDPKGEPRPAAAAISTQGDFHLTGQAYEPAQAAAAKVAHAERRTQLRDRIQQHARWVLEHPVDAAALNAGGRPIATISDFECATRARCRAKRIPGFDEGDVLEKVCASEWHLFAARRAVDGAIVRARELGQAVGQRRRRGVRES